MLIFATPKDWSLELPPAAAALIDRGWRSLAYSQPGRRWDACLGQLCLDYLLPWLQRSYGDVRPWLKGSDWPAIWQHVPGCAIVLGDRRLILMPSDGLDGDGLVVPQEWVDLPDWAGDYYLAVQVQTDPGDYSLRVWGYAAHQTLKAEADYDADSRSYSLPVKDLTLDMSSLETIAQLYPNQVSRAAIEPLTAIPPVQAANLLDRLLEPNLLFPRLELPFAVWGALIQDPVWRERFYRSSQGEGLAPIYQLGQWLEGRFEGGWQSLEALLGGSLMPQLRRLGPHSARDVQIRSAKRVTIEGEGGPIELVLVILVQPDSGAVPSPLQVQVQLHPLESEVLPPRLILGLYDTERRVSLQRIESLVSDSYVQLGRFRADPGECFEIQIEDGSSQGQMVRERFQV
jgi:hypothetical protein